MIKLTTNHFALAIILGLGLNLSVGTAQADKMPSLWGAPETASPESLHAPEQADEKRALDDVSRNPIYFRHDKATLTHEGQLSLDAALAYFRKHSNIKRILVEGHTDYTGPKKYNESLSDKRTDIVRNYLTVNGIDPDLIATIGKGEQQPVDQNWTREGRIRNRHVGIYAVHWSRQQN